MSGGNFGFLQGPATHWLSSYDLLNEENPVFAKTQNGHHKFGLVLFFVIKKYKLLITVKLMRSGKNFISEIEG